MVVEAIDAVTSHPTEVSNSLYFNIAAFKKITGSGWALGRVRHCCITL